MQKIKIGDVVDIEGEGKGILEKVMKGLSEDEKWCVIRLADNRPHYCRIEKLRIDGEAVEFDGKCSW